MIIHDASLGSLWPHNEEYWTILASSFEQERLMELSSVREVLVNIDKILTWKLKISWSSADPVQFS